MENNYRDQLILAEQKAQGDYDKSIVSLSGGALGISLVFIKDIIGAAQPLFLWCVVVAWSLWAFSIMSVVISYFTSGIALRKATAQHDKKEENQGRPGGCAAIVTQIFNILSGSSFVIGIVFFIIFSANNIEGRHMSKGDNGKSTLKEGYMPPSPPPSPVPRDPNTAGTPTNPVPKK